MRSRKKTIDGNSWSSYFHELGYEIRKEIGSIRREYLFDTSTTATGGIDDHFNSKSHSRHRSGAQYKQKKKSPTQPYLDFCADIGKYISFANAIPIAMVLISLVIGFSLGYDQALTSMSTSLKQLEETQQRHGGNNDLMIDANDVSTTYRIHVPKTTIELLGQFSKEYRSIQNKLKEDYADYVGLFTDKARLDELFQMSSEESKSRYLRRIVKKLVAKQIQITNSDHATTSLNEDPTTFTWISAGDASAAGYGNLFEESYTSALHDTVLSAFSAVGINFIAKNAGIAGYGSGPDLSLCMESVFGDDIDVLTYDFGMMDGDKTYRAGLWASRAAVHPSRPLLLMIDSQETGRWDQLVQFEKRGTGVALFDTASLSIIKKLLPDSANVQQIEQLPTPLQYFICGGATEGTQSCYEPQLNYVCEVPDAKLCMDAKFSTRGQCSYERYHANWLPGWKEHRFRGRLLGLFLVNLLQEGLIELDKLFHSEPISHLSVKARWEHIMVELEQQDQLDLFLFENSKPPDDYSLGKYTEDIQDLNLDVLLTKSTECLIASQTAQDLYEHNKNKDHGENDIKKRIRSSGVVQSYEGKIDSSENIVLVNGGNDKEEGHCGVVDILHRDFFFAKQGEKWQYLKVPVSTMKRDGREGYIAVCFDTCSSTGPDAGTEGCISTAAAMEGLAGVKLANGNVKMKVNGEMVTGTRHLDGCYFLEGPSNGFRWQPDQEDSSYTIQFRANEENGSFRIFSVIFI